MILFGTSDLLTEGYPKLQKSLYYFAFFITFFLFTIKYYYGADIKTYVPHYETIAPIENIINGTADNNYDIEFGYNCFCSILKYAGVSFYWMTVIVSLLYFSTIFVLFQRIQRKQSLALMILVLLDFNLIFATYRQCLSVAFFLIMIMAIDKKKYFLSFLAGTLTILFHKAGVFVILITIFYYLIHQKKVKTIVFQILFVILTISLFIPIDSINPKLFEFINIPAAYVRSIEHHLSLGRQFQTIFIIYAMTLLCIEHYTSIQKNKYNTIVFFTIIALFIVVVLYKYYYILTRIRSFFIPIVIVYVFNLIQRAEDLKINIPYHTLIKQSICLFLIVYFSMKSIQFNNEANEMKNKIYRSCTIFDLHKNDKYAIQKRQLEIANRWWDEDFTTDMKNANNKIEDSND